jgi:hypothetical protein
MIASSKMKTILDRPLSQKWKRILAKLQHVFLNLPFRCSNVCSTHDPIRKELACNSSPPFNLLVRKRQLSRVQSCRRLQGVRLLGDIALARRHSSDCCSTSCRYSTARIMRRRCSEKSLYEKRSGGARASHLRQTHGGDVRQEISEALPIK